ncbi:MAG: transglutaminase family protein [Planctomycetota bacterium]
MSTRPGSDPDRSESLDVSEIPALVDLLADPEESVAARVEERLRAHGPAAESALRGASEDSEPRRRTRARRLLEELTTEDAFAQLRRRADLATVDLESALFDLAALNGSLGELADARAQLDLWGEVVLGRVGAAAVEGNNASFDAPMALVEVLAEEVGLNGASDDYHHPDNVQLHRVVARLRGMPLSLCAIYLFVARRAGLRVAPVALPGHVILRLYSRNRSMLIDPFDGGAVRTRKECLGFLLERGLSPRAEWFADATDAALFQRHLINLANSHRQRGRATTARRLQDIAGIVAGRRGLHPAGDPESA